MYWIEIAVGFLLGGFVGITVMAALILSGRVNG